MGPNAATATTTRPTNIRGGRGLQIGATIATSDGDALEALKSILADTRHATETAGAITELEARGHLEKDRTESADIDEQMKRPKLEITRHTTDKGARSWRRTTSGAPNASTTVLM